MRKLQSMETFASASFLRVSRQYLGLRAEAQEPGVVATPIIISTRKIMNQYRKFAQSLLVATGLGVFLAGPVFAEPACDGMDGHHGQFEQHAKMREQHHQQLHDALKLTPEQEPGWKKLMESEQPRPATSGAETAKEDWSKLTTPERAEKMLALGKARQEHMSEYVAALKGFYATLTVEQKKTFEDMHAGQRGEMHGKARPRQAMPEKAAPKP